MYIYENKLLAVNEVSMSTLKVKNGNTWIEIPAGGQGVPSGGTTGQFLRKSSSTDYATEWSDATGGVTSVNGMTGDVTISTIAVQDSTPVGGELVWIDTDESGDNVTIPQIDDDNVSEDDTWSSQKISDEISTAVLPEITFPGNDANNPQHGATRIYHFDSNTLNTAFKAGIASSSEGIILSSSQASSLWGFQLAFGYGEISVLYARNLSSGSWGPWGRIN